MMRLQYAVAFALLLFASAYAADANACAVLLSADAISIFMLGMIISILLVALWYMFGVFMGNPEIEAVSKLELQQIGLTFLLAVALSVVLPILCNINVGAEGVSLGVPGGIFVQAEKNIYNAIQLTLSAYLNMANAVMDYSEVGSIYTGATFFGITVTFVPFGAYTYMAQVVAPVAQSVIIAYFALIFQYALLKIVQSTVFLYLIPIGLVLRTLSLTRKFGGVLIALAIGMSFIYPLVVNIGFILAGSEKMSGAECYAIEGSPGQYLCYKALEGINPDAYIWPTAAVMLGITAATAFVGSAMWATILTTVLVSATALAVLGLPEIIGSGLSADMFSLYSSLASITLVAFFIPALEVLLVGALVRSLSGSLGAETDISGIMRAI
jgi:hypothetical protein